MNNQIFVIIFCIGLIEIIQYSQMFILIKKNLKYFNSFFKIFKSINVSDHWKEKLIIKYSADMLLNSLKILIIIFFIVIFFILLHFLNEEFKTFVFSLIGSIEITLIALIYYNIRKKLID